MVHAVRALLLTTAVITTTLVSAPPASAAPERHPHALNLTFSPLHFFGPMFEAQIEVYLGETFSLAALGGVGTLPAAEDGEALSSWDAGGAIRAYFHGWPQEGGYASVEAVHLQVNGDIDFSQGAGPGLGVGPLMGYKAVWPEGAVVDLAGGPIWIVAFRKGDKRLYANFNLNMGWAF